MIKPPVVFNAGMLRALARPIDRTDWSWLCEAAGQVLFYPPDVAGWDDNRWLDTSTIARPLGHGPLRRRQGLGPVGAMNGYYGTPRRRPRPSTARSRPGLSPRSPARRATRCSASPAPACRPMMNKCQQSAYRAQRQNALLQLIASSPDLQTS